jgi:hypothetical protein
MQPREPSERRSARRKARFYRLERLQRLRAGDSGSCGVTPGPSISAPAPPTVTPTRSDHSSERQSNYTASRGGGADVRAGNRWFTVCLLHLVRGPTASRGRELSREYRDGTCCSLVVTYGKRTDQPNSLS